tara:strand:+ start:6272 stop:7408 length:1137 start_codon:yes stop_codon:yes gene_type:complete
MKDSGTGSGTTPELSGNPEEPELTTTEIAERTGLTERGVRKAITDKRLPGRQVVRDGRDVWLVEESVAKERWNDRWKDPEPSGTAAEPVPEPRGTRSGTTEEPLLKALEAEVGVLKQELAVTEARRKDSDQRAERAERKMGELDQQRMTLALELGQRGEQVEALKSKVLLLEQTRPSAEEDLNRIAEVASLKARLEFSEKVKEEQRRVADRAIESAKTIEEQLKESQAWSLSVIKEQGVTIMDQIDKRSGARKEIVAGLIMVIGAIGWWAYSESRKVDGIEAQRVQAERSAIEETRKTLAAERVAAKLEDDLRETQRLAAERERIAEQERIAAQAERDEAQAKLAAIEAERLMEAQRKEAARIATKAAAAFILGRNVK